MTRINYDTDVTKHYVRSDGWLEAFKFRNRRVRRAIVGGRRTQPLTYFTFFASSDIDVFMLERAKLIKRDKDSGRLEYIYYCDADEQEFARIASLIGSGEAGFMERFESFVLFKDNRHTRGRTEFDPTESIPDDAAIRRTFGCKALHDKFVSLFPFDVINLDFYGNLFPPNLTVYSPLLQSIEKIFEWQNSNSINDDHTCEGFTIFLTIYIQRDFMNQKALQQLIRTANGNLIYPQLQEAFSRRYPHGDPVRLMEENFPVFFSIMLPKVIAKMARKHGWAGAHRKIYLYNRPEVGDYHMMTSIVCYEPFRDLECLPGQSDEDRFLEYYLPEIASVFQHKPADVNARLSSGGAILMRKISADLSSIIDFRAKVLADLAE